MPVGPFPLVLLELQRELWAAQRESYIVALTGHDHAWRWSPWRRLEYRRLRARAAEAERRLLDHPVMRDAIAERKWARTAQAVQRAAREATDEAEAEPEPAAA